MNFTPMDIVPALNEITVASIKNGTGIKFNVPLGCAQGLEETCRALSSPQINPTCLEIQFAGNLNLELLNPVFDVFKGVEYVFIYGSYSGEIEQYSNIKPTKKYPICGSVIRIDINIHHQIEDSVRYIRQKFPNLETVSINKAMCNFKETDLSRSTVAALFSEFHKHNREKCEIRFGNTMSMLEGLSKSLEANTNVCIEFILDSAEACTFDYPREDFSSIVTFQKKEGGQFQISFDEMDTHKNSILPCIRILNLLGKFTRNICFNGITSKSCEIFEDMNHNNTEYDWNNNVLKDLWNGKFLGAVFSGMCPALDTLTISRSTLLNWDNRLGSTAISSSPKASLTNLIIDDCLIGSNVLCQFSKYAEKTLKNLHIDNVTMDLDMPGQKIIVIDMPRIDMNGLWLGLFEPSDSSFAPEKYYLKVSTSKNTRYFAVCLNKHEEERVIERLSEIHYFNILARDMKNSGNLACRHIHIQLKSLGKLLWRPFEKDKEFKLIERSI